MAVVVGALMLHGITPGPMMMTEKPQLFWGIIASMYIGNVMLLVLNLPLVQLFALITKVPKQILLPLITLMCLVGVYSVNSSYVDLYVLALFGILGFILRDLGYSPAPLVLALVIGPMMETAMRESLMINQGAIAPMIFRPIAGTIYLAAALALIIPPFVRMIHGKKKPPATV
jgi:putative tricarboxylic transport membrane protein